MEVPQPGQIIRHNGKLAVVLAVDTQTMQMRLNYADTDDITEWIAISKSADPLAQKEVEDRTRSDGKRKEMYCYTCNTELPEYADQVGHRKLHPDHRVENKGSVAKSAEDEHKEHPWLTHAQAERVQQDHDAQKAAPGDKCPQCKDGKLKPYSGPLGGGLWCPQCNYSEFGFVAVKKPFPEIDKSCPFCKSETTMPVSAENKDRELVRQCMKCSQRYSTQKSNGVYASRDEIAMRRFGKPFNQLTPAEQGMIGAQEDNRPHI